MTIDFSRVILYMVKNQGFPVQTLGEPHKTQEAQKGMRSPYTEDKQWHVKNHRDRQTVVNNG